MSNIGGPSPPPAGKGIIDRVGSGEEMNHFLLDLKFRKLWGHFFPPENQMKVCWNKSLSDPTVDSQGEARVRRYKN